MSVVDYWHKSGVALNPGASLSELQVAETRLGCRLPDELRALYTHANGMPPGVTDPALFFFWPLSMLTTNTDGSRMTFGDGILDSHQYSIQASGSALGRIHVEWDLAHSEEVAVSLHDFWMRLMSDPLSVYLLPESAGA